MNWTAGLGAECGRIPWDARPEMRVMNEGRLMMRCVRVNGRGDGDRACDRG